MAGGNIQVWSLTGDMAGAVEHTLNLQVLKSEPYWVFALKIERDWRSKT